MPGYDKELNTLLSQTIDCIKNVIMIEALQINTSSKYI